jgi:hypothetical protein
MTVLEKNLTSLSMNSIYGVVTRLAPLFFATLTGPPLITSTFKLPLDA